MSHLSPSMMFSLKQSLAHLVFDFCAGCSVSRTLILQPPVSIPTPALEIPPTCATIPDALEAEATPSQNTPCAVDY
jgi:hypothetical protein